MAKIDSRLALMAVLAPEEDDSRSATAGQQDKDLQSFPSLEDRVDLFLRALHGTRAATPQERVNARRRILDAIATDLAGKSNSYLEPNVAGGTPVQTAKKTTVGGSDLLARLAGGLREALLWPLSMPIFSSSPMRLATVSCATLLVAGGAWTATWFYAAKTTETAIAGWIDSEAKAGRDYSCGSRNIRGFPIRIEVSCTAPQATLAMSDQSTIVINAKSLRTFASVLSPGTLVSNIDGPVSVTNLSQSATFVGNWSLAQLTLHGQLASPSRISVVFHDPDFYRVVRGTDEQVLVGGRLELNATAVGASVVNIAARAVDVSIPVGGPIASRPFVAEISAALHKVDNRTPQLFSTSLREWQSRGGSLEVAEVQLQQGDALATGAGQIRLNDSGRLDGALRVSTVGAYQRLAQSFIGDGQSGARERERLAQTFLGGANVHTRSLGNPKSDLVKNRDAGQRSERQKQQVMPQQVGNLEMPIRFSGGAVFFGSTRLGDVPPLF